MKTKNIICLGALMAAMWITSIGSAAEVSQGKCTVFDPAQHTLSIEEYGLNFSKEQPYGEPTGVISNYDIKKALIGIAPEPGDILRIAYTDNGGQRIAVKVMNVSKQDLRKK